MEGSCEIVEEMCKMLTGLFIFSVRVISSTPPILTFLLDEVCKAGPLGTGTNMTGDLLSS